MKLVTTLLIALLVALSVYAARRRIWYSVRVGAIVYVVVLFGRLVLSAGSLADRWEDWVWPLVILLIAWVVLWAISTNYAHRKAARKTR